MNKQHSDVLTKVLVDFMTELKHLDVVVNSLKKDGVLNDIDYDNILKHPNRSPGDKVRELLETLSKSGPQAFGSFVKALNRHQKWLATRLQTELVLSNAHVKEIFKSNSKDVGFIVNDLFARDVLSDQNKKEILDQYKTKESQVEELLRILPSTKPEALAIFTDVLISRQQTELVSVLKEKREMVERSLAGSHFIPSDTTQSVEEQLVNTKRELQAKQDETKGLEEEIKKEKLKNEKLRSDYELLDTSFCSEVNILKDNISSLARQLAEEQQKNKKLKEDYEKLKKKHCSEVKDLQENISKQEDELIDLEEARENESKVHQKLEKDNKTLQVKVDTLEDKISRQAKHLDETPEEALQKEIAANAELKANNSCLAKELDEVKKARDDESTARIQIKYDYEKLQLDYMNLNTAYQNKLEEIEYNFF